MGIWKKIAESIKDAGDDWEEVQDLLEEGDNCLARGGR